MAKHMKPWTPKAQREDFRAEKPSTGKRVAR